METSSSQSESIEVAYNARIPRAHLNELHEHFLRLTPYVTMKAREPSAYVAWEWILPAAVIIYLGKSLLDGFLKELGAQGARTLKDTLTKVFSRTRQENPRWVTVEDLKVAYREMERAFVEKREPDPRIKELGKPGSIMAIELKPESKGSSCFVFPYELNERQFLKALEKLPLAISKVGEVRQAMLTLEGQIANLMKSNPDDAEQLRLSRHEELDPEIIYVYLAARTEWVDVKAEDRREREAIRNSDLSGVKKSPKTKGKKTGKRKGKTT